MQVIVPEHIKEEISQLLGKIDASLQVLGVNIQGRVEIEPNQAEVLLRFFPNDVYPGKVFGGDELSRVIEVSPKLKWFHNGMTGMEDLLYPNLVASDIIITNAAGAHRVSLAECTIGMILFFAKRMREHLAYQQQSVWQHLQHSLVKDRTVLIIGLGRVGRTVAQQCKAFNMRVLGIKRRKPNNLGSCVDCVGLQTDLDAFLPDADYVVITAALTSETRNMIDEAELRVMRRTAYLINIARGAIINEYALARALREGWIAGAWLDVFNEEPLPPASPLWTLPNLIMTPHNAGWSSAVIDDALGIFRYNYECYISGKPMKNIVDKLAGY